MIKGMEDKKYREIFSDNLRYYMEKKGYSQKDLLKEIKVSKATMSTWCRGTRLPRIEHIQELADKLGIEKKELLEKRVEKVDNIEEMLKEIKKVIEVNRDILINEDKKGKVEIEEMKEDIEKYIKEIIKK